MAARSRVASDARIRDQRYVFPPARPAPRPLLRKMTFLRKRRVLAVVLGAWLLYLFFTNMPTDVPSVSRRSYDSRFGRSHQVPLVPADPNVPPGWNPADGPYDGPIRFFNLASSLHSTTHGTDKGNVLLAVANLKALPRLLPFVCSMASNNRTVAHLAFLGREMPNWDKTLAVNGIKKTACPVVLHDARPDYPAQSSDKRMDVSARAGVGHIHSTVRLHAVITGDTTFEEKYFVDGIRDKATALGLSSVALPTGGSQSLAWVSSLDASALQHMSESSIDIIVHAHSGSSGSLIRLLRSLKRADYSGWALPRLTVELPADVDPFLQRYISDFEWPHRGAGSESRLIVRHRLDASMPTPAVAALRTLESFYPPSRHSHVLILSSNVEVSPGYYQFMMYSLLEYAYTAQRKGLAEMMIGISLELPTRALDKSSQPPWAAVDRADPVALWQSPTSNAGLYFGDFWKELHEYMTLRLRLDPQQSKTTKMTAKLSREYPSWLQSIQELMQIQNNYMLYPTISHSQSTGIVTVHQEDHHLPEEFSNDAQDGKTQSEEAKTDRGYDVHSLAESEFLTANEEVTRLSTKESEFLSDSLVASLVELEAAKLKKQRPGGILDLPLFSYDGSRLEAAEGRTRSQTYASDFARSIGQCSSYATPEEGVGKFTSLFCSTAV